MNNKLVWGVGIYKKGQYVCRLAGKITPEYQLWKSMLERCYSEKFQEKNPTYLGCSVSDNFKNFQYFARWCNTQVGFGKEGYQCDKDIIFTCNKEYSEGYCAFIPRELNLLLTARGADRGLYPVGVYWSKPANKFVAQLYMGGKSNNLGYYDSPEQAFSVYKTRKEAYVKEMANKYKDSIDSRVYDALMKWTVNIDD